MSHEQLLATLSRLEAAERAACGHESIDVNSVAGQCPAYQPYVFVLPVRYALSEEASTHAAAQPGVTPQSHPMAARLLREGFVYVWQGSEGLKRYAVAINRCLHEQPLEADDTRVERGKLFGLTLSKHEPAWMLYSEYPLTPEACQQLADPQARAQHMRVFDLRQLANELRTPHCVPLNEADQLMGELIPETYARTVTLDHLHNGKAHKAHEQQWAQRVFKNRPTDNLTHNITQWLDAQRWNSERIRVAASHPEMTAEHTVPGEWSAVQWAPFTVQQVLEGAHQQAQGLYAVLACLDDDLGVLRDINHEQEQVESRHEQWQQDHQLRLSIGGFIRSLITEDGAEVAGQVSYRYREHELELTPEQGEQLLKADRDLHELFREEARLNQRRGRISKYWAGAARLAEVHDQIKRTVASVREFIPAQLHTEVEALVRDYRASKVANLENHFVSEKVEQYIDLPAMNTWLDHTAPNHFAQVQQRHTRLYADRGVYLLRHHSGTWFVDFHNPAHQTWLGHLAMACLSAQCLRKQGAEQYADYVRSADQGALRQLFYGWSPTLEAAVIGISRSAELMAALSLENQANAEQALIKILGPLGAPILANLAELAREADSAWNSLIKRLGAALLLLGGEPGAPLSGAWLSIMVAARVGSETGLRLINQSGRQVLQLVGKAAEDMIQWAKITGKAIGTGHVAHIVNSPAVQKSGGVIALAALLLNSWNAGRYLSQAQVLEGVDQQRQYETASATLYAAAALVAVIDAQVRKGFWGGGGVEVISLKAGRASYIASVMTMLGGILGFLSSIAAFMEYKALQIQLDNMQGNLDPWLKVRQTVSAGFAIASGVQAMLGMIHTSKSMVASYGVALAQASYLRWLGPINVVLAVLGVFYVVSWFMQRTPLQNFLAHCCWSKLRAGKWEVIAHEAQAKELMELQNILFTPRLSFENGSSQEIVDNWDGFRYVSTVESLTVDLPGAGFYGSYVDISIVGDPVDTIAYRNMIKNNGSGHLVVPPRPMRDIGKYWIETSTCNWIPYKEGQGIRLSGLFNLVPDVLGTQPRLVSVRIRYRTPITSMLNLSEFIGGQEGLVFTCSPLIGLVAVRDAPTPELNKAERLRVRIEDHGKSLKPLSIRE
ncbi:toxin VasX [Pseudomonas lundensis]|uniref:toxin VasX n=1 Tax=Pseudomonas lundensis TaxID=86185 RepID=UPI001D02CEAD|nr:toxin VasX [Pseudomonas lundensis]